MLIKLRVGNRLVKVMVKDGVWVRHNSLTKMNGRQRRSSPLLTRQQCVCWVRACVTVGGDLRPGVNVGKADASEAAGNPAPSFPCSKGNQEIAVTVSNNNSQEDDELISVCIFQITKNVITFAACTSIPHFSLVFIERTSRGPKATSVSNF